MKLAYSVATPDAPGPLMSFCGNFERDIRDIKAIGYDAVELFVRDPREMDTARVRGVIEKSGLAVAAVGTNPALVHDGLSLLADDSEVRAAAVKRVMDIIDFAAVFGAPVCIGKFRGNLWGGRETEAMEELADMFGDICAHAAKKGISVMLEPQNKASVNNFITTAEAAAWIESQGFANLGILFDTFHADLAEASISAGISGAGGKIGFVHCSDSDRLPPGVGAIPLTEVFAGLGAAGYDGYVSMEINQKPDSFTVAELSYKVVRYIIENCV